MSLVRPSGCVSVRGCVRVEGWSRPGTFSDVVLQALLRARGLAPKLARALASAPRAPHGRPCTPLSSFSLPPRQQLLTQAGEGCLGSRGALVFIPREFNTNELWVGPRKHNV